MNLVVTGATSFLGAALIKELLNLGHQVYGVARPGSSNRKVLDPLAADGLKIIELELSQLDHIAEYIPAPCQVFFHFGWDGSGSENRKKTDIQNQNVLDGLKALEGARTLGCRRFLFSGSQAEYGICQTVMGEERTCHPVSEYGKAKVAFYEKATELVRRWMEEDQKSPEYIHTRIFSVYGPGDHPWSLVNTCLKTFSEHGTMKLGACTQQWNFLYIEDLVKGLTALAFCQGPVGYGSAPSENGIYNVAGAGSATMPLREYVEQIYHICGGQGRCLYGELPPNAEGQANLIPDIGKIRKKTGWKPEIGFEEGMKRMLEIKTKTEIKTETKISQTHRCILCGQPLKGEPLMTLNGMPASAQDIPGKQEVETDQGVTLHLHQCRRCGLVQFDCEPVAYYRDVIRSGGYSTTMVNLRSDQYRHLIDTYHLEGKKFLEVGCGRGEFLKVLTGFPVQAFGVEHRKALVETAVGDGLWVTEGFTETPDTILGNHGPYDVFLSFNFLEHQPEPGVMLDCIWNNLTEGGMGLVTVPSFEYIMKYDGYYELIRDHIAYYTFDTLRYLMERHGFEVLEEELVNRDTISVIVKKKASQPVDVSGLTSSLTDIRRQIEQLCDETESKGWKLAVWGASHQGFTLAATTCLGKKAAYIIDSAPFKQGKFAPASHLPIISPDDFEKQPVDVILIVAPGYTEEIAAVIRKRFGDGIQIMTLRSERIERVETAESQ